ncbi:MAG: OadG family protein [Rubrivivax sp.]|nr:OadG family protein [Rubrivivax sp.]
MNDLGWGLQITVLGMGLVFALLALLWGLLTLVLRFDQPQADATRDAPAGAATGGALVATPGDTAATADVASEPALEPHLVAAITAAVLVHVSQRRKAAMPDLRIHWPGSLLHASRWVASGRLRQNRTFRKGRG